MGVILSWPGESAATVVVFNAICTGRTLRVGKVLTRRVYFILYIYIILKKKKKYKYFAIEREWKRREKKTNC